jgi:carboxyl-terminal processing protease
MRTKILLFGIGAVVLILLVVGSFSIGMFVGGVTADEEPPVSAALLQSTVEKIFETASPQETSTPEDIEELFEPFWQSWDVVHDHFIDQPVDNELLMQGAIRGMMESLDDQHSSYMDPDQQRQASINISGEYEGIGAWVDPSGEYLTIVSPMRDSPAEKAGLQPGDQIIAVDGEDMTGIDGSLVIRRVVGPVGTSVTLTIFREGEPEPFDVTLERAKIELPALEPDMLEDNIAYINLFQFSDDAVEEMEEALKVLLDQDPDGLILDIRFNPGGGRDTAVKITSQFIDEGVIMYQLYGDGSRDTFNVVQGGLATDIPLVVLVNEGSASGSEILAGAVQDYERGYLVGTTTFGKGSVQSLTPLVNEQGLVRVTIARWLTPNERTIHGQGLEPDYEVEITEEDIENERDPQLDKAIELLTNP